MPVMEFSVTTLFQSWFYSLNNPESTLILAEQLLKIMAEVASLTMGAAERRIVSSCTDPLYLVCVHGWCIQTGWCRGYEFRAGILEEFLVCRFSAPSHLLHFVSVPAQNSDNFFLLLDGMASRLQYVIDSTNSRMVIRRDTAKDAHLLMQFADIYWSLQVSICHQDKRDVREPKKVLYIVTMNVKRTWRSMNIIAATPLLLECVEHILIENLGSSWAECQRQPKKCINLLVLLQYLIVLWASCVKMLHPEAKSRQ